MNIPDGAELRFFLAQLSPSGLAAGWAIMLAAMMVPLMGAPLQHVRTRSLARTRLSAMWYFASGYLAVWLTAGLPLILIAVTTRMIIADQVAAFVAVSAMAVVWQVSRWKRTALNRCHARPPLTGIYPAFWFGLHHGLSCLSACAPLMTAALLAPVSSMFAMVVAATWIWLERLEQPRTRGTGLIWPRRAFRASKHICLSYCHSGVR